MYNIQKLCEYFYLVILTQYIQPRFGTNRVVAVGDTVYLLEDDVLCNFL